MNGDTHKHWFSEVGEKKIDVYVSDFLQDFVAFVNNIVDQNRYILSVMLQVQQ